MERSFMLFPLSELFARIFSKHSTYRGEDKTSLIARNNGLRKDAYVNYIGLFKRYGNLRFIVANSSNVLINANGKDVVQTLEGEKGIQIINLTVNGRFLFTLRKDAVITMWDYKKNEIVREIKTIINMNGENEYPDCLEVNEDFIMFYGSFHKYCEIISKTREDDRVRIDGGRRYCLKNKKVVMYDEVRGKRRGTRDSLAIKMYDLTTKTEQLFKFKLPWFFSLSTYKIDLERNALCFSSQNGPGGGDGEIFFLNPSTGNELKRIEHRSRCTS